MSFPKDNHNHNYFVFFQFLFSSSFSSIHEIKLRVNNVEVQFPLFSPLIFSVSLLLYHAAICLYTYVCKGMCVYYIKYNTCTYMPIFKHTYFYSLKMRSNYIFGNQIFSTQQYIMNIFPCYYTFQIIFDATTIYLTYF